MPTWSCQRCREPVAAGVELCACCRQRERLFAHCIAPLVYTCPVSGLIKRAKYSRQLLCVRPLVSCLQQALAAEYGEGKSQQPWPEALIPVPLHWWKLRCRGFNLAAFIARRLGTQLDVPVLPSHVRRLGSTRNQQGLSARARQANVRQVFSIKKPVRCRHLALVDDVLTTGATAESLCRTLCAQGVKRVDLWCLARTPGHEYRPTDIAKD